MPIPSSGSLTFSLMGPIEVARDGVWLPVRSLKTRALLALLLLHRGQPVSLALLIERIWGEPPPPTARASARNVVSGLRKTLGYDERVSLDTVTNADGYVLNVPAESVDLTGFDDLRTRGRGLFGAGELDAAADCLLEALALWRGPALVDLVSSGLDWPEFAELTGSWLDIVADLVRIDLMRRRYREVLVRLASLLDQHPDREDLHQARIIALHRCGRRAEAAGAYLQAHRLVSELTGSEPSAEFRDVYSRLLAEEYTTVDMRAAPRPTPVGVVAPTRPVRRSDGGSRSLIPRIGSAKQLPELAHEIRAVAVLYVRVCPPTDPASVIEPISRVVREHYGVVGEIRATTVVSYFGLGATPFGPAEADLDDGAAGRAAACAIALHQSVEADRVQAGDLTGTSITPTGALLACVVSAGPIVHIVRENGPGEVLSWVASELIGLCEQRAEQVRPGETAIF